MSSLSKKDTISMSKSINPCTGRKMISNQDILVLGKLQFTQFLHAMGAKHIMGLMSAKPNKFFFFKSCIRETKHLSTDADSSTDTTTGWTKNTQKHNFFEKRKKISKLQKPKTSRYMPKLAICPLTRGV